MATIRQRSDGSFQIRVSCGFDNEGNRIQPSFFYTPKKPFKKGTIPQEVKEYAQSLEQKIKQGIFIPSGLTFAEFLPIWKERYISKRVHLSTLEEYEDFLRLYCVPKIGNMPLEKIDVQQIQGIIDSAAADGKSAVLIKRLYSALNSVFTFAYKMKAIIDNPCTRVIMPRMRKDSEIQTFNEEQARRFLDEVLFMEYPVTISAHSAKQRTTGKPMQVSEAVRMQTLSRQMQIFFTLAIYSGCRRGELVALQWDDINFQDSSISIRHSIERTKAGQHLKDPKTISGFRNIILPPSCFDLLTEQKNYVMNQRLKIGTAWKGEKSLEQFGKNYVFITAEGAHIDLNTPTHAFHDLLIAYNRQIEDKAAKEEEEGNKEEAAAIRQKMLPVITLHGLRHCSASLLIGAGVDIPEVSRRLGHSRVGTTLNFYTHGYEEHDSAAADTLGSILSGSDPKASPAEKAEDEEEKLRKKLQGLSKEEKAKLITMLIS